MIDDSQTLLQDNNSEDDNIVNRLFDPELKQRPDIWQFIKLVTPTEEKKKWKSKEAISAYCLKCHKVINYTRGTSKQTL